MKHYHIELQPLSFYFLKWEKLTPEREFLKVAAGDQWRTITWKQAGEEARRILSYLHSIGIKKGDHIGIISKNCPEWIIADIAILLGGMVSVPFFANLTGTQLSELIINGDVKALFVGKLDEWETKASAIPNTLPIVSFRPYKGNAKIENGMPWEDIMQNFHITEKTEVNGLNDLWTILYTSGTTGAPKGVMHQHKSPASLLVNEFENNDLKIFEHPEHRFFSYLPLNHIAERIIVEYASICCGATVYFAENIDTFAKNLQDAQPTIFMAVPRIWTKFQMAILEKIPQPLFSILLKIPILSQLLKNKIKKGLGLSEAKVTFTGAAHCSDSLKEWFWKLDIKIQEVYGMTENGGGVALMPHNMNKRGYVGRILPNVKVKIEPETQEIYTQTPWTMSGYYNDRQKTEDSFDGKWLKTGDQGEVDSDNFLKITGRVSDHFKTAKGKFVVPAPIEDQLMEDHWIEQVCITGNGLNQPKALVVLSEMAQKKNKNEIESHFLQLLEKTNSSLSNHERIDQLIIAKSNWSVENNLLTPTLKIKRNELSKKYMPIIERNAQQSNKIIYE